MKRSLKTGFSFGLTSGVITITHFLGDWIHSHLS